MYDMWNTSERLCKFCGTVHDKKCPQVKSVEFYGPCGSIKKVIYFSPVEVAAHSAVDISGKS